MSKWIVMTDGGSPKNPGPASYAFVLTLDDRRKITRSGYLPDATNNIAEYAGMTAAAWFIGSGQAGTLPDEIEFWSDSQLIVRQLAGQYSVGANLREWHFEAKTHLLPLERSLKVSYNWFRREHNKEADELCNEVLRRHGYVFANK